MAYSAAALSSVETSAFTNDKPMLVANNSGGAVDAHWTFTGLATSDSKGDANFPSRRAFDYIGNLITKPVASGGTVTAASQASTCVVGCTGHGFANGDKVFFLGVGGMDDLDYETVDDNIYEVANKSDNAFELAGTNSTGFDAFTSGGTVSGVKWYHLTFQVAIEFDTLLITGHNFNSGGAKDVQVEIANNSGFSSGKIEIYKYTVSGTTDNRILVTNLNSAGGGSTYAPSGTAQRYSALKYVRVRIIDDMPSLGEIFLGRRYQLEHNPNLAWNNKDIKSDVQDFASASGLIQRYVYYKGQAVRTVELSAASSTEIAAVEDWFTATQYGTRPFAFIETPSSDPSARLMLLDSPRLNFALVGPFERRLSFGMTEQPPFLATE
tara:strand:+ start:6089 stop:7231 length:1143 start_codon:yes stop_codon:yes gene_type:complete